MGPEAEYRYRLAANALFLAVLATFLFPGVVRGHVLKAPAVVTAERDGSFDCEALFRVGPGNERISMYSVSGSDNLDGADYDADGECVFELEEGDEVSIALSGSLVDSHQSGTLSIHLVTCGVSGQQTVFDAEVTIVPPREHSIFWVESGAIRRTGLEGGDVETVVDPDAADAAGRVAVDPVGGRIYWTAWEEFAASVRRTDLFGAGVESFPGGGGKDASGGIAVDLVTRELSIADTSDCVPLCGSISRVRLDATDYHTLIQLNGPEALVVNSVLDRMCWSDAVDERVVCSDVEANGIHAVVGNTRAGGVALDPVMDKIYWTDKTDQRIRRADPDGSNLEELVTTGLGSPGDIALDPVGRKMYWTDSGTDRIQRSNLDGSDVEDVLTGLNDPTGIALLLHRGSIELELTRALVRWSPVPGAWAYDAVRGDLGALRDSAGSFAASTVSCVADTVPGQESSFGEEPEPGQGFWFLVRAVTVTGNGTYDAGACPQAESRDAGIVQSGFDCD